MSDFAVSDKKNRLLKDEMDKLGIYEKDIEEKFIKSSGKGGQKVNKTSSCVYIKHLPTGIEVKCMKDRSQSVNRFLARRKLLERLEHLAGNRTKRDIERDKLRRQKSKKKKRGRLKYGA